MVRRRDHAEDVLDRLRQMAETTVDQPIPPQFCEVATHVLLELGKGAFAHHLRVLERYLPVFKALALTSEDRQQLLASSVDYWKHNIQQQIIVFGKYHFYQILDASDIVTFVFSRLIPSEDDISAGRETAWTNVHAWDLLNVALEQQYGFAIGSNRKKVKLGREDEEARARKKELDGGEGDGMVVGELKKIDSYRISGRRLTYSYSFQTPSHPNSSLLHNETPIVCATNWIPSSSILSHALSNLSCQATTSAKR